MANICLIKRRIVIILVFFISLVSFNHIYAIDLPYLYWDNATITFNTGEPIDLGVSSDESKAAAITKNMQDFSYDIDLASVANTISEWNTNPWSKEYSLRFTPNSLLESVATDTSGRTVFKVTSGEHGNVGVVFGIHDYGNSAATWINDKNTYYCVFNDQNGSCGYRSIGSNIGDIKGSVGLLLKAQLWYVPDGDADQYFDLSTPKTLSGSVTLGRGELYRRECDFFGNCNENSTALYFSVIMSYYVTVTPVACRLDSSGLNQTIDMGKVSISQLKDNKYVEGNESLTFNFECPTYAKVNVRLTAYDMNSPTIDNKKYLSVRNQDTSELIPGVGIALLDDDDTAITFDSIEEAKLSIGTNNSQTSFSYHLKPYYYYTEKGEISAGKIYALGKLVFSYQ